MKILNQLKQFYQYKWFKKLGIPLISYYNLINFSHTKTKSILFHKPFTFTNKFWYKHGLQELFIDKTYWFKTNSKEPVIIDCGANIGLSIIYFKKLYPNASITGFEPDQSIFEILKENLAQFQFEDVVLENKAVWKNNDFLNFRSDGSVGGNLSEDGDSNGNRVETARLKDYLDKPVSFLKIDIEGAEYEVLKDCSDKLQNVNNIFVEYHSSLREEQKLSEILKMLKEAGFRYYIKEAWENMKYPFIDKKGKHFDLQLNIFGYRI